MFVLSRSRDVDIQHESKLTEVLYQILFDCRIRQRPNENTWSISNSPDVGGVIRRPLIPLRRRPVSASGQLPGSFRRRRCHQSQQCRIDRVPDIFIYTSSDRSSLSSLTWLDGQHGQPFSQIHVSGTGTSPTGLESKVDPCEPMHAQLLDSASAGVMAPSS